MPITSILRLPSFASDSVQFGEPHGRRQCLIGEMPPSGRKPAAKGKIVGAQEEEI
jgi:hypothetical protein